MERFHWRRELLPTPVFWPGEFHGLYSPRGCKELDMNELPIAKHIKRTWFLSSNSSQTMEGKHMELNHCDTNSKQYTVNAQKKQMCLQVRRECHTFQRTEVLRFKVKEDHIRYKNERWAFLAEVVCLYQYCFSTQNLFSTQQPEGSFQKASSTMPFPSITNKTNCHEQKAMKGSPSSTHLGPSPAPRCSVCSSYAVFAFFLSFTHLTARYLHLLQ